MEGFGAAAYNQADGSCATAFWRQDWAQRGAQAHLAADEAGPDIARMWAANTIDDADSMSASGAAGWHPFAARRVCSPSFQQAPGVTHACAAEPAECHELPGCCVAQEWAAAGLEAGFSALQQQPLSAVLFARLTTAQQRPAEGVKRPDQQLAASDTAKREPRDAAGFDAMQSLQQQLAGRDCMMMELQNLTAAKIGALLEQLRAAEDATAAAVSEKESAIACRDSRIQELLKQQEEKCRAQQEQAGRELRQLQSSKESLEATVKRLTCEANQAAAQRAQLSAVTAAHDAAVKAKETAFKKLTDLQKQAAAEKAELLSQLQAAEGAAAATVSEKDSRIQELLKQHEKERHAQEQAARALKQLQSSKESLEAAVKRLTCERAQLANSLSAVTAARDAAVKAKDAAARKVADLKQQVTRTEEQMAAAGQATRQQLAAIMRSAQESAAQQAKQRQHLDDLHTKAAIMAAEYAAVCASAGAEAELRLMNTELRVAHAREKAQLEQQAAAARAAQEQLQADNAAVRGQLAAMQKLNRSLMVSMALQRLASFGRSRQNQAADGVAAAAEAPKHCRACRHVFKVAAALTGLAVMWAFRRRC